MYEYTLIYIENRFWLLVVETAHYAIRVAATTYLDFKSTRLWLHLDSSSLCPILQRLTLRITSRRTPHTNVWNAYRAKIHARQRTGQAVNSLHIMEHQLNEHKVGLLVNHLWFQLTNLEKRIGTYVQSKPITPTTAVLFAPHHWLSTLHDTHNIDSTRPVVNEDKTSKKEMMKDGETLSWNVLHMLHLVFLAKVLGSPWGLSAGDWAPRQQSGEAWHALIELHCLAQPPPVVADCGLQFLIRRWKTLLCSTRSAMWSHHISWSCRFAQADPTPGCTAAFAPQHFSSTPSAPWGSAFAT